MIFWPRKNSFTGLNFKAKLKNITQSNVSFQLFCYFRAQISPLALRDDHYFSTRKPVPTH